MLHPTMSDDVGPMCWPRWNGALRAKLLTYV